MEGATRTGGAEAAGVVLTWREAPLPVKAVIAGIMVNRLGGFLQVFLVLYMVAGGYPEVRAGFALAAHGAGAVAGILLGGWLVGRIGVRASIVSSMTANAALTAGFLYAASYPVMLLLAAGTGAASQVYRPASAELVSRLTGEERRVMVFAMYRLATNLGTTAAPLIGAALVAHSYALLFWAEAAAALGVAVLGGRLLPRDRPGPAAADRAGTATAAGTGAKAGPGGYRAVLADRSFVLFLLAILGFSAVYTQYLSTLPLAVRERGLDIFVYGVLVAVNGLIVIVCELVVTRTVQRWPARIATIAGILAVGVGLAAYALPWGVAGLVAATVVWSVGEIIGSPTMTAYPALAAAPENRGRYLGASQAMFGVGSAVGPAAGVAAWALMGDAVWLACGALAALAALAAFLGMPASPKR
ncbi:MFS transporter [Streptomyces subrutilus]|uniref:MFS transporter n=1 Tax=Streptomyces subrutilus TaxID=36818 RepID=A0A5P2UG61_9ACTN|nr:MFS transporter [Streptomyces subrutilus]QEU78162.1 MFS transporter [Streptomyces subrutilus]WSJ32690.1 MFS transporter [Streptomyces subrutilus]GGZ55467.1 MFS transporter [Streptomyces subrutilus]